MTQAGDNKGTARIVIRNLGQQVMPVELQLTFADGSTQLLKYPVEIWYKGDRYVIQFPTDKQITVASVNPDGQFPDLNPANDAWKVAPTP